MGFVFGDQSFKKGVFDELLPEVDAAQKGRVVQSKLPIKTVISAVADFYQSMMNKSPNASEGDKLKTSH
jgi:hypothetical protein